MRRFFALFALFAVILTSSVVLPSRQVMAQRFSPIRFNCAAVVIEVIDGASIMVKVVGTGETGLVRLIGISVTGDKGPAFNYLSRFLLGNIVALTVDPQIRIASGIWNNLHAEANDSNVSERMLSMGFASVNEAHSNARNYWALTAAEQFAKSKYLGIWYNNKPDETAFAEDYAEPYKGPMLNINTASAEDMSRFFGGGSAGSGDQIVNNIVSYRRHNPFGQITDLKFVPGVTKDFFDKNREKIVVSTNVRTASLEELRFLNGITAEDAQKIIDYRSKAFLADIEELKGIIGAVKFTGNADFMSIGDVKTIDVRGPYGIFNINEAVLGADNAAHALNLAAFADTTVKSLDMVANGYNLTAARQIITAVINGHHSYSYKTFDELANLTWPWGTNAAAFINMYSGNMTFGEGEASRNRVNLNTAAFAQLRSVGLTYEDAEAVFQKRGTLRTWALLADTVDITGFDARITLYTNINKASEFELKSLGFGDKIIEAVVDYRDDQPFGSRAELLEFFHGIEAYFDHWRALEFVVVR
jgi:competence ComEA-like helix-hairpin-helix protein